ncbi:MAG TPA: hypothetical protein VM452_18490 [Caulifigura sp.]|nr:hypothetical protein [Caulifigura sp.]
MTCDDAFDLLTGPERVETPPLADHLACCPRCRAMAETLAPAIELFRDSPSSMVDPVASSVIAERAAARLARRAAVARAPRRERVKRVLGVALAALGGAACCFAVLQLGAGADSGSSMAICPRRSTEASEWLNKNAVPLAVACVACHPPGGGIPGLKPAATLSGRTL